MDMYFDSPPTPVGHKLHPDIVRVVDDPADQMLNSVDDDGTHCAGQLSVVGSDCSPPSAGASVFPASSLASAAALLPALSADSAALAAFFAGAFFFGFAASVAGAPSAAANAALNSSSLLGLAGVTFRRPSAPGSPLNFCQSPVIFSSFRTGSVG